MKKNYTKPMLLEVGSFMELANGVGKKAVESIDYVYNDEGKISKVIYNRLS